MAPRERYPERNAKIIAMRKAGERPTDIAEALNISKGCVAGVLGRAGLSAPNGGGWAFRPTPEARRAIGGMASRTTYAEVAAEFNVSPGTVARYFQTSGA